MGRAADADSLVGDDVNRRSYPSETIILIRAQIHLIVPTGDGQCLRQFSGTRTKPMKVVGVTSLPHQRNSAGWFERTDENKPVFVSFHQYV
jgi:hypothetical protein